MNWYKKAQASTWGNIIERVREDGIPTKYLPEDDRETAYATRDIYQFLQEIGLRKEEMLEVLFAKMRMPSSMKVKNPQYFIEWVRNNSIEYPNISMFNTDTLNKIWNIIKDTHYMRFQGLINYLKKSV